MGHLRLESGGVCLTTMIVTVSEFLNSSTVELMGTPGAISEHANHALSVKSVVFEYERW